MKSKLFLIGVVCLLFCSCFSNSECNCTSEISDLKYQVSNLESDNSDLESRIEELESKIEELESQVSDLESDSHYHY